MVEQKPEKLLVGGSSPFLVNKKMRMAEWFKVAVLKAVVRCTVGSNPTPLSYKNQIFIKIN